METLYDKASLILNPGIYDTGKVYCTKPLDGSGDLTFTRASNATRVNADGLIEKVRTNLFVQSQALASTWSLFQPSGSGTIVRTNNYATAPDGTMTATRIQNTGTSAFQWVYQNFTHENNTISVYAKSTSGTNQTFRLFGSNGALNSANFTATNTWQRFTFRVSAVTTVQPIGIASDSSGNAYDILFWGAQLEQGDVMTDYIPTTTAAVSVGPVSGLPRLDYSGGATCPSLLLEPQRTNLALSNESLNIGPNSLDYSTVTPNVYISPDGYQNADQLTETTTNGRHGFYQYTIVSSQTYTASIFTKQTGRRYIALTTDATGSNVTSFFDLQTKSVLTSGTGHTCSVQDYGNGWLRLIVSFTASSASRYFIWGGSPNGTDISYVGSTSFSQTFWGYQLEAGSYPTSYIPTLGSAVTRLVDNLGPQPISADLSGNYTLFFDAKRLADGNDTARWFYATGLNSTNLQIYFISGGSGRVRIFFRAAGQVTDSAITWEDGPEQGDRYKMAIVRSTGSLKLFVNGSLIGENTTSVPDELTYCNIFSGASAQPLSQYLIFETALTNAQAIELTTL